MGLTASFVILLVVIRPVAGSPNNHRLLPPDTPPRQLQGREILSSGYPVTRLKRTTGLKGAPRAETRRLHAIK